MLNILLYTDFAVLFLSKMYGTYLPTCIVLVIDLQANKTKIVSLFSINLSSSSRALIQIGVEM